MKQSVLTAVCTFPCVCVCSFADAVGVIYVTVIAPIIAVMAVLVAVVVQILLLPLTLLTGQRPTQINFQQVFNELVPSPLRYFQRLLGAMRIGSSGPSRIHLGVSSQPRAGRVSSVSRVLLCKWKFTTIIRSMHRWL